MTERYRLDERAGLSREESAAYVGVGTTLFDQLVTEGLMPAARQAHGRIVWVRSELDSALLSLPNKEVQGRPAPTGVVNPWNRDGGRAA